MNDENKLYWLKMLLSVTAALICSAFRIYRLPGIGLGLLIYLTTYPLAVFVLKVDPTKSGGPRKILLSGLITYLFIFTVIWSIIFTLQNYSLYGLI